MWKKVLAALLIFGLIFLFLVRDQLVETMVKSRLDDYCLECFGCQMQCKNTDYQQHRFVFEKPEIATLEGLKEGGIFFKADKISIDYSFQWLRCCLDLDIQIENPRVSLKNDVDIKTLAERFWQGGLWLPIRPVVTIIGGAFDVHDLTPSHEKIDTIYYALDINLRDIGHGYLQLSFGDPAFQKNAFEVALLRDEKMALDFKADFRKLDLAAISRVLNPLYRPLQSWEAVQGSLDGSLSARRWKGKRLETEGRAFLRDLNVMNKDLGLKVKLAEAQLNFTRDAETLNTTVGQLKIEKDCSLVIEQDHLPIWEITNVLGDVTVESHDGVKINLHGQCASEGNSFDFRIQGDGRHFDEDKKFLKLKLALINQEGGEASAFIVMKQLNDLWNSIDMNLQNFGSHEFQFVQGAMSRYSDDWRNVRLHQGTFNASVMLHFKELHLHDLKVKKFAADRISFDYYPLNLHGSVEHARGGLAINLAESDILRTLNTELSIEGGQMRIAGKNEEAWQLSNIQTKLAFQDGVIQKSTMKGDFLGLEGDIAFDWLSDDEIMKVRFQGLPRNFNAPVPEVFKKGIEANFSEDLIALTAGLKVKNGRLYVEGILEVEETSHQTQDDIAFGFTVEKISPELWSPSKAENVSAESTQQFSLEVLERIMPTMASPALLLNHDWMPGEKGISGLVLRDGWVYGENLLLEKYVAPFVFQPVDGEEETPLRIEGMADFRGSFDHTGLGILYHLKHLIVENDHFHFEVDTLFYNDAEDEEQRNVLGYHYANFATGQHFGMVPVKHGTYLEKHSGLLFNEVSTQLKFNGNHLYIKDLDTYCSGIHFAGNIHINSDFPEVGSFDVEILADTMNGKLSNLQNFFSHFETPPLFTSLPMEGDLHFRDEGASLLLNVRPEGTTMEARVQAALSDGFIALRPLDISLQEFGMHIDYDQKKNQLVMDEISGTVLVGRGERVEEYLLAGDKIAFTDLKHNISAFDVWVGDRKRDIIRIAGTSNGDEDPESPANKIHFQLDRTKTHFGDVYPTTFAFSLKNWLDIENFQLDFDFQLSTLFKDLQRVSRSGLFFFPIEMLEEFNQLKKAHGEFKVHLGYDQNAASFCYAVDGKNVDFFSHSFDQVQLTGKVRDKTWAIDQLRFDDLSMAAEVMRLSNRWRINFLGLRRGESLLVGLNGDYDDQTKILDANINLLEMDMSHAHEWPQLEAFVAKNSPKGEFKGKGKLQLTRSLSNGTWICDASLAASAQNLSLRGVSFSDAKDFSLHWITDRGITLRNLVTAMVSPEDLGIHVPMRIEKIDYDTKSEELEIERAHFSVAHQDLTWFAETLQKAMPEDISDRTVEIISSIKEEGVLNTTVSFHQMADGSLFQFTLEDGLYRFADHWHQVRDFKLAYSPDNFFAQMEYLYQRRPLMMSVFSDDPDIEEGTIVLADPVQEGALPPASKIVLQWVVDPVNGFTVKEAKGAIAGLELHLQNDPKERFESHHQLKGWANVVIPAALNLCEEGFIESCYTNKIGGSYLFKGKWAISKDKKNDSTFFGDVEGWDLTMKGYQFEKLSAQLNYSTKKAIFKNLEIQDPSGKIDIPTLTLTYWTDEAWWWHLPELQISNFRPSALRDMQLKSSSMSKTLVINRINVSDLKGKLADSSTWVGKGMLKFSNPSKSSLQNTIFAIPHEIITRIGLNPAVLTPVSGTIYYDIKNGRVVFTKFKDVYSESRASKFYLPNSSLDSYVDFDGNIFVQVKMKQYNLLFKLAELFTFNVKGTLEKPVYMIQKQEK